MFEGFRALDFIETNDTHATFDSTQLSYKALSSPRLINPNDKAITACESSLKQTESKGRAVPLYKNYRAQVLTSNSTSDQLIF
jgi:hypothetical protein